MLLLVYDARSHRVNRVVNRCGRQGPWCFVYVVLGMHDQDVQARRDPRAVQGRLSVLPATRAPRRPEHDVLGRVTAAGK